MTAPRISLRQSLLVAADALARATGQDTRATASALRDVIAAVEHHLDTLAIESRGDDGRLPERLRPMAAAIEERLRGILVSLWEVEAALRDGEDASARLPPLAAALRETADDDLEMVFDSLRDTGALD